jgi:hypothetical protein
MNLKKDLLTRTTPLLVIKLQNPGNSSTYDRQNPKTLTVEIGPKC